MKFDEILINKLFEFASKVSFNTKFHWDTPSNVINHWTDYNPLRYTTWCDSQRMRWVMPLYCVILLFHLFISFTGVKPHTIYYAKYPQNTEGLFLSYHVFFLSASVHWLLLNNEWHMVSHSSCNSTKLFSRRKVEILNKQIHDCSYISLTIFYSKSCNRQQQIICYSKSCVKVSATEWTIIIRKPSLKFKTPVQKYMMATGITYM